jgi:hypothetical protein
VSQSIFPVVSPWCSEEAIGANPKMCNKGSGQLYLLWVCECVFARNGDWGQGLFDHCSEDLGIVLVHQESFDPGLGLDFCWGFSQLELGPKVAFQVMH